MRIRGSSRIGSGLSLSSRTMVDLIISTVIPLSIQEKYQQMIPVHLTFESVFAFRAFSFCFDLYLRQVGHESKKEGKGLNPLLLVYRVRIFTLQASQVRN